jgi:nucleoside-diphosphate-sugar epimerase
MFESSAHTFQEDHMTDQPTATPSAPTPQLHVIAGKGPVGSTTADVLVAAGHRVRVLSRSGGPSTDAVEHVAVDVTDADAVRRATRGADVLYNCLNPEYHRWATDWPPMASALLDAAEAGDAVYVIMGNLYGYGPVDGPLTEDLPLAATGTKGRVRAAMWDDALARHRAGRVRVTEARASDFWGPRVTDGGYLGERAVPRLLAGKRVQMIGDPTQPHSWTYIPDVARALVRLGTDERAWGRPWHVPTAPARSVEQMVELLCDTADVRHVAVSTVPWPVVRAMGLVVPFMRELRETRYQFTRPFVLDSSAFTRTFGDRATPTGAAAVVTLDWWRDRSATTASHSPVPA